MQTKKISSNSRKRSSAHQLVMKSRQAQAAKATPVHPRLRARHSRAQAAKPAERTNALLRMVKKHPVYCLLSASTLGLAVGYFFGSKK